MLCLSAGPLSATIAVLQFTLAWTHSIEKIRWEEDWRIDGALLHLDAARIRGSGAGMEIPPDARLIDGVWHYRPTLPAQGELQLAHSPHAAGYQLCPAGQACRPLAEALPGLPEDATVRLAPCP